jgi:hypothetical protein
MDHDLTPLLLLLAVYFLPGMVASVRHHRNRFAIGMLNLLLGWTLLGWIAAMVWACTADVEARPIRERRSQAPIGKLCDLLRPPIVKKPSAPDSKFHEWLTRPPATS